MEQQNNQQFNTNPQINPVNLNPNPVSSEKKEKSILIPLISAIVLTAIIVGGAMYWWMIARESVLDIEINNLKNQASQLTVQLAAQASTIGRLNDELIEMKVLKSFSSLSVEDVLRDSQDKNRFYYVMASSGDVSQIAVYDLTKDSIYQQNGNINIAAGSSALVSEKVGKLQEFRLVGITGDKLVFTQTKNDDSPGPCFSSWLYPSLNYVILNVSSSTKQLFTLPSDLKQAEEQKALECQQAL